MSVQPIWFDPKTDEVLFTFRQWFEGENDTKGREFPVTLCKLKYGRYDLHAQTGEKHVEAIEKAAQMLAERGLIVEMTNDPWCGPTGAYYHVWPCMMLW